MKVGESWAHRAKKGAALIEVEVTRVIADHPPRARVLFLSGPDEGREKWVPAGRLKTPWSDRVEFLDREAVWERLEADGRPVSAEQDAAWAMFEQVRPGFITIYGSVDMGIGAIRDLPGLCQFLGWEERTITCDGEPPASDEGLLIRWGVTKAIAQRMAELSPDEVFEFYDGEVKRATERGEDFVFEYMQVAHVREPEAREFARQRGHLEVPAGVALLARWAGVDGPQAATTRLALERDYDRLAELALRALPYLEKRSQKQTQIRWDIEEAIRRHRAGLDEAGDAAKP